MMMDDTQSNLHSEINEGVDRIKHLATAAGHNDVNGELSSYAVAHAVALVALAEEAFLSAKRIAQIEQALLADAKSSRRSRKRHDDRSQKGTRARQTAGAG
jgi:hypothetical protein